ncbi:hypothetical protein [Halosimplex sp. J119]
MFEEMNTIDGTLRAVTSRGSDTAEFLMENFKSDSSKYDEIVYISGNPQTKAQDVDGLFHEMIPVWATDWDDELRTVHPSVMEDRILEIHEEYPQKRLIGHFIQPHYPFIGETGSQLAHRTLHGEGEIEDPGDTSESIWARLQKGEVEEDKVWEAYRENLELVIPHLQSLVEELDGKTVITSDHGNAFGRFGQYGHPTRRFLEELVKVPWLEIECETRKTISAGEVTESDISDSKVEDRLSHLGYK